MYCLCLWNIFSPRRQSTGVILLEDLDLLLCGAVPLDELFWALWKNLVPPCSRTNDSTLERRNSVLSKMWRTTNPITQYHNPEVLNPQLYRCSNFKFLLVLSVTNPFRNTGRITAGIINYRWKVPCIIYLHKSVCNKTN